MRRLTTDEVHAHKVAELGLDPTAVDLTSVEAIAGALRRSASFRCPCAATTLVRSVVRPIRGLVTNLDEVKESVEDVLEAMIAHGDILEQREVNADEGGQMALLYAAPPSFVARQSGLAVLLGLASDQLSALPDDLERRIEYVCHVRRLRPIAGENLAEELVELGLVQLSYDGWLKPPSTESPRQHLSRLDRLLSSAEPSRDIPGLQLLETERPVRYYRGRWVEPKTHSGRFVARRHQAYGADLWCYVELRDGHPERLIDLPIANSKWRGCDEGWRLQMAIDAERGEAQKFKVQSGGPDGTCALGFYSPVPMWARRRWDAIGEPVPSSGCLFAYRFSESELEEELRFAKERLWLEELTGGQQR